ncbi:hypothetical protein [Rhodoplanes elegans]|uniref:hypothetical protein n=1 Tax=Rhodoplanes elegans TaxID=29408 RepID=UPI0014737A97|nr:hypothetical protein [Rhodoplanes elegans]
MDWWSRNDDGVWCNVCGNLLKAAFHCTEEELDEYEPEQCRQCDAPDEIDPDAI